MSRQYTDEQLQDLAKPFEMHAIAALRRGDLDEVKRWLKRMLSGAAGLDALSAHTLARKAGKLRQDLGDGQARAALERIGVQLMKTWVAQIRCGDVRGAIADLIAVFKHQGGARAGPLTETQEAVVLDLSPCGSGGRLERQGLHEKHPQWYGGWDDGVSSLCQACKACQRALNAEVGGPAWTTEKSSNGQCRVRFDKLSRRSETIFSAEECATLPLTRVAQAQRRLDSRDNDIEPLLDGQRKDWMPWHDFGVVWLEYFYATALEIGGPDYLDETLAQTYEPAFVAGFPRFAAMNDDELLREMAQTWNYHCTDFLLTEEDDRFVFTLDPCGSGGRLFRGQMWRDMFHYGEPMSPLMEKPHNINFNRKAAPAYCTHCAASNRAQLRNAASSDIPMFFVIDGHAQMKPGQACREFTYKKGGDRSSLKPVLLGQIGL